MKKDDIILSSPIPEPPKGYRILGELGRGSFSTVYLAEQQDTGRQVALKMLHFPEGTGEAKRTKIISRFKQELALAALLDHPYITRLLDKGAEGTSSAFAAFEYEPGITLKTHIFRTKGLPAAEALILMEQVLEALADMHRSGIVHRDLKPQNIWVSGEEPLRAKIFDFGISAYINSVTEAMGTAGYASPEQLSGDAATAAADIYSWALVLLECLTGSPVLKNVTTDHSFILPDALHNHPLGDLLCKILHEDPEQRPQDTSLVLQCYRKSARIVLPYKISSPGAAALSGDDEITTTSP